MQVFSPLTNNLNVVLRRTFSSQKLVNQYKEELGLDVSRFFQEENFFLYEDLDTGYKFFYPFYLMGDGNLYEILQNNEWYYMDWKWEHELVRKLISPKDKVLEIGCAKGGFLSKMEERGNESHGLEMNEKAVKIGQKKGLTIFCRTIEEHAATYKSYYDVVCSFQVLEHIAEVGNFIKASLETLKPGGRFIISVPYNHPDSIILKNNVLNMPPHHMGLWNSRSLISLQNIFNIRLQHLEIEPLQNCHIGYYTSYIENLIKEKHRFLGKFAVKIGRRFIKNYLKSLSPYLLGHTILAEYKKL